MKAVELAEWRVWLDRVKRRTDVADVPVLISRLDRLLAHCEQMQTASYPHGFAPTVDERQHDFDPLRGVAG